MGSDSSTTSTTATTGPDAPLTTTQAGSTTTVDDSPADDTVDTTIDPPTESQGSNFLGEPDLMCPGCFECDAWAQDCAQGDKCTPWANDGGEIWNSTRCTDFDEAGGQAGDPCTVEGSGFSGIDDCTLGALCWSVDPRTNTGLCVDLCMGHERDPSCDGETDCIIANEGFLSLCLPTCHPLLGDCPLGQACVASYHSFVCTPTPSIPAQAGEPCTPQQLPYACDSGHACLPATRVGAPCDEAELGCCTAYCDLSAPDPAAPCAAGQVCASYWGQDPPPAGLEDVGACVQP